MLVYLLCSVRCLEILKLFSRSIHYNHESLFYKLGNHESLYFGSEIMNNETLRKGQLIGFDPGNAGYGVSESPIF